MTGAHPEIGAELRALAQAILDRLDPAVRFAAARAAAAADRPGACQQVWCPVCALAAAVRGEQHPLLAIVAEHSVALLTVIRAVVDTMDEGTDPPDGNPPPPPPPSGGPREPSAPGRYQSIPVTVQE